MIGNVEFNIIALIVSLIAVLLQIYLLEKEKSKNQLHKQFMKFNVMIVILIVGLLLQLFFSNSIIPPVYFEYISYTGAMFIPSAYLIIAVLFWKKNTNVSKLDWLYIIPIICLLLLWTNDIHHLFYEQYSTAFETTVYGPALMLYAVYSYIILIVAMLIITISSIKRTGLFSMQAIMIVVAAFIPLLGNAFGFFNIAKTTVYTTPILFSVMSVILYVAIFKLKALNIIPVTTRTIVNSMSDSYVVISDDGTIVDMNKTFLNNFSQFIAIEDNDNIFELMQKSKVFNLKLFKSYIIESRKQQQMITKESRAVIGSVEKYFEVDIQPILARDREEYVATLVLIRDVTSAKRDMEMMVKNENLVILGELAGGVAHDINTPISAIKSGILILKDCLQTEDEKMLLKNMDSCADKIIALTNSLRNQIRNLGSVEDSDVDITTILNDIALILSNELKKRKVNLTLNVKENVHLQGNPTKLSQVLTNIITNAIQAYDDKGGNIEVIVEVDENKCVLITVEDWAGGIPESVRPYIFKNILTTKGVAGTGFGLYLAYSIIKGAFGGEISFSTKTGKGTCFTITLPLNKNEQTNIVDETIKIKKKNLKTTK